MESNDIAFMWQDSSLIIRENGTEVTLSDQDSQRLFDFLRARYRTIRYLAPAPAPYECGNHPH